MESLITTRTPTTATTTTTFVDPFPDPISRPTVEKKRFWPGGDRKKGKRVRRSKKAR